MGKTKKKAAKNRKPITHILDDWCKGCGFCVEFCPKKVLVLSDRFNSKGFHPPEAVKPDDCTGCHICQMICPEFAIFVEFLED